MTPRRVLEALCANVSEEVHHGVSHLSHLSPSDEDLDSGQRGGCHSRRGYQRGELDIFHAPC